jgi:hypothetical protein
MRPAQKWLEEEGIIYTGFWEPIHFLRQRGSTTQNSESFYDFIKSEEYIGFLAGIGVNQLWCNFSKGYGLEFEKAEQLKIREMCPIAKRYNMRVMAYCTGGSLTPETIRYEAPDVADWCAKTEDGKLSSYGAGEFQNFRARPCYSSRGYMDFQKRTIDRALDYGCDGIHFDNTVMPAEPQSCKCNRCVQLFREFLARKYNKDNPESNRAGLERWGRTDFSHAKEPWFNQWNQAVLQREMRVANHQDWALFKQELFATALKEWADHIHTRGAAVEYNVGKGFNVNSRMWDAINDEKILPHADIIFNEGAVKLGYSNSGAPLTRIREHKVVQGFDVPMMTYNHSTHMLAEAFSFNPGMVGMWSVGDDVQKRADALSFFKFYKQYRHYQTRQTSLAQTAVYLHNEALTFSQIGVYHDLCSVTQLLQEERIPFNFLHTNELDNLSKYRLLIAPSMNCITDAQAAKISAWVRRGGRLLTSGKTGTHDDYFRRRTRIKQIRSVDDMLHAHDPENAFTPLTGEDHMRDFVKPCGDGLVAHITELEHSAKPDLGTTATWMLEAKYIVRPANSAAIVAALDRLLPAAERNLRVASQQDLLVDLCRRSDTGEGLIHLFNVSFAKSTPGQATVEVSWPERINSLTWISYDRGETPLNFKLIDTGAQFSIDAIRESAVIIINKK